MQAVILAGGLGKRLRSKISGKPKPMADIGEKPFLEYQLEFLKRFGLRHLIFCVGYLHEQIEAYFGDGSHWNIRIDYAIEHELLGTAGAIKNAEPFIEETFLTLNGDSFFDIDLTDLIQAHQDSRVSESNGPSLGTIALTGVLDARKYGSVKVGEGNKILSFNEKAQQNSDKSRGIRLINAGIYVLETDIFEMIAPSQKISLEKEVFPSILKNDLSLYGYPLEGFFVDIGTPEGYQIFQDYLKENNP